MSPTVLSDPVDSFQHLAMFYEGPQGFADEVIPFISRGLEAGEATLVAVGGLKIELLRDRLGAQAGVRYEDIRDVGRNPARIIPLWTAFVEENRERGRAFRGVGEPIWRGRTSDELAECERHEALLNMAFGDTTPWILACPYDMGTLDATTLAEARRNHPWLSESGATDLSRTYRGTADIAMPFSDQLPEAPGDPDILPFAVEDLASVRRFVQGFAANHALPADRVDDLVLAADEVAANSIRHGGGRGLLRCWFDGAAVVCEIRDHGTFDDVMAGRHIPAAEQGSGYGLWVANQLCDLVQIRSFSDGSVVRLHVRL